MCGVACGVVCVCWELCVGVMCYFVILFSDNNRERNSDYVMISVCI